MVILALVLSFRGYRRLWPVLRPLSLITAAVFLLPRHSDTAACSAVAAAESLRSAVPGGAISAGICWLRQNKLSFIAFLALFSHCALSL